MAAGDSDALLKLGIDVSDLQALRGKVREAVTAAQAEVDKLQLKAGKPISGLSNVALDLRNTVRDIRHLTLSDVENMTKELSKAIQKANRLFSSASRDVMGRFLPRSSEARSEFAAYTRNIIKVRSLLSEMRKDIDKGALSPYHIREYGAAIASLEKQIGRMANTVAITRGAVAARYLVPKGGVISAALAPPIAKTIREQLIAGEIGIEDIPKAIRQGLIRQTPAVRKAIYESKISGIFRNAMIPLEGVAGEESPLFAPNAKQRQNLADFARSIDNIDLQYEKLRRTQKQVLESDILQSISRVKPEIEDLVRKTYGISATGVLGKALYKPTVAAYRAALEEEAAKTGVPIRSMKDPQLQNVLTAIAPALQADKVKTALKTATTELDTLLDKATVLREGKGGQMLASLAPTDEQMKRIRQLTLSVGDLTRHMEFQKAVTGRLSMAYSGVGGMVHNLAVGFGLAASKAAMWITALGGLYAVFAIFASIPKIITEVQQAVIGMEKVMRGSNDQIERMSRSLQSAARTMSVQYAANIKDVMDAMTNFIRLGWTTNEVINGTKVALMAQNIAGMSAADASKSLVAITVQYKLAASDLMTVLDMMNQLENTTYVRTADLAAGMQRAGVVAKQYGVTLSELAGMVAVISQATGRAGNEIGNSLRTILSYINRPGTIAMIQKQTKGLLGGGIEAGPQRSATAVLADVAAQYDRLSPQQQHAITMSMAGVRQLSNLVVLLENWDAAMKNAVTSISNQNNAIKENQRFMGTVANATKQVVSAWQGLITSGPKATVAVWGLTQGARFLTTTLYGLQKSSAGIPLLFGGIGLIGGIKTLGGVLNVWTVFMGKFAQFRPIAVANTQGASLFATQMATTAATVNRGTVSLIGLASGFRTVGAAAKAAYAALGPWNVAMLAITAGAALWSWLAGRRGMQKAAQENKFQVGLQTYSLDKQQVATAKSLLEVANVYDKRLRDVSKYKLDALQIDKHRKEVLGYIAIITGKEVTNLEQAKKAVDALSSSADTQKRKLESQLRAVRQNIGDVEEFKKWWKATSVEKGPTMEIPWARYQQIQKVAETVGLKFERGWSGAPHLQAIFDALRDKEKQLTSQLLEAVDASKFLAQADDALALREQALAYSIDKVSLALERRKLISAKIETERLDYFKGTPEKYWTSAMWDKDLELRLKKIKELRRELSGNRGLSAIYTGAAAEQAAFLTVDQAKALVKEIPLPFGGSKTIALSSFPVSNRDYGKHRAYDIPRMVGTEIRAPEEGKMFRAGGPKSIGGYGIYLEGSRGLWGFLHAEGKVPLGLENATKQNPVLVREGTVIGYTGNTGRSTGPHVHFQLRNPKGELTDPLLALAGMQQARITGKGGIGYLTQDLQDLLTNQDITNEDKKQRLTDLQKLINLQKSGVAQSAAEQSLISSIKKEENDLISLVLQRLNIQKELSQELNEQKLHSVEMSRVEKDRMWDVRTKYADMIDKYTPITSLSIRGVVAREKQAEAIGEERRFYSLFTKARDVEAQASNRYKTVLGATNPAERAKLPELAKALEKAAKDTDTAKQNWEKWVGILDESKSTLVQVADSLREMYWNQKESNLAAREAATYLSGTSITSGPVWLQISQERIDEELAKAKEARDTGVGKATIGALLTGDFFGFTRSISAIAEAYKAMELSAQKQKKEIEEQERLRVEGLRAQTAELLIARGLVSAQEEYNNHISIRNSLEAEIKDEKEKALLLLQEDLRYLDQQQQRLDTQKNTRLALMQIENASPAKMREQQWQDLMYQRSLLVDTDKMNLEMAGVIRDQKTMWDEGYREIGQSITDILVTAIEGGDWLKAIDSMFKNMGVKALQNLLTNPKGFGGAFAPIADVLAETTGAPTSDEIQKRIKDLGPASIISLSSNIKSLEGAVRDLTMQLQTGISAGAPLGAGVSLPSEQSATGGLGLSFGGSGGAGAVDMAAGLLILNKYQVKATKEGTKQGVLAAAPPTGTQEISPQNAALYSGFQRYASGITGAVGMYAAYQQKDSLGGMAAGASLGTAIAPGIGTVIGAGVGLLAGLFGKKPKKPKPPKQYPQLWNPGDLLWAAPALLTAMSPMSAGGSRWGVAPTGYTSPNYGFETYTPSGGGTTVNLTVDLRGASVMDIERDTNRIGDAIARRLVGTYSNARTSRTLPRGIL